MRIAVTGGSGFLGLALARRLLAERADLDALLLADRVVPPATGADVVADPRVEVMTGDLVERRFVDRVVAAETDAVYHLASVVSAGAEADFDLGYAVNLHGSLALLERCRAIGADRGRPVRLIFASSLATFGSGAGHRVDDDTGQRPETSYGVQKACVELLINDYHRKGFVVGWSLRLPTVVVRPGEPNRAASGFASSIIREPLAGVDAICPVDADTVMAVISPRRVVEAFHRVLDLDEHDIGHDRTVQLPGLAMRIGDAIAAVAGQAGNRPVGRIEVVPDPAIQRIVDSWPQVIEGRRAEAIGLGGDDSVAAIVRQHIDDELGG